MRKLLTKFVNHICSLAKYCFGSQSYQIKSKYRSDETLSNIVSTQKNYGIHVISEKDNITLYATEHVKSQGPRRGTPIVPVSTGKFVNENGDVVLTGTIALEFGIKMVMSMFCVVVYILLPLMWTFNRFGSKSFGGGPFWGPPLGIIVFTCLLEFGYGLYKKDVLCIKNFLESALNED